MGAAAAVKKEIDEVTETLEETVAEMEDEIAPDKQGRLSEETKEAVEALKLQREVAATLEDDGGKDTESIADVPPATIHIEKIIVIGGSESRKRNKLKSLRIDSERIYRKLHLLRPESLEDLITNIYWFSQQGSPKDLDILYKARFDPHHSSAETLEKLNWAEQLIIKRTLTELPGFFNFTPCEVARVNEATIAKSKAVTSPYLRKVTIAERPSQVISQLNKIKAFLQNRFDPQRISRWLSTPLEVFEGKSPRDALLEGKTFQVLHLLERMDDNPHY
jgi:hypothetical protein